MEGFNQSIKYASVLVGVLLLLFLVGWLLTSDTPLFLGLMLGTIVGLINSLHLAFRINRLGKTTAEGTQRRFASLGTAFRYSTVILAVLYAIKNPETVSLFAFTLSLLIVPMIALLGALMTTKKNDT